MGLGAPKIRKKLSQDPNNTAWSKSTNGFGHKILAKQGWKPGDYLGAENAGHSEHYTAANASHIKVLLREENLGLGAQVGKINAETFGLSLFSSVLGRLNGKSDDEVQRQQDALRDAELRKYQSQKHGLMNFVRGGLLVGDKIEPFQNSGAQLMGKNTSKKRKEPTLNENDPVQMPEQKKTKKEHISKRDQDSGEEDGSGVVSELLDDSEAANRTTRKSKTAESDPDTRKKRHKSKGLKDDAQRQSIADKKASKRARKEERRMRKEEKRKAKIDEQDSRSGAGDIATAQQSQELVRESNFGGSRHAVRHRYIQQKRMAVMDSRAMKEIFMLNAAA